MGKVERVSVGLLVVAVLVAICGLAVVAESNVTHFTGVAIEDVLRVAPQDVQTVTNGMTLSPAGAFQPLQAIGANRGFGAITAGTAGDVVLLQNVLTYTVCVSDTGSVKLGGDRTLGQNDTVLLVYDGSNWIEVSYTNNQAGRGGGRDSSPAAQNDSCGRRGEAGTACRAPTWPAGRRGGDAPPCVPPVDGGESARRCASADSGLVSVWVGDGDSVVRDAARAAGVRERD